METPNLKELAHNLTKLVHKKKKLELKNNTGKTHIISSPRKVRGNYILRKTVVEGNYQAVTEESALQLVVDIRDGQYNGFGIEAIS